MNKVNWELKIDGKFKKDYDLDELDLIAEKITGGILEGQIWVDLEEDPADRDDRLYHEGVDIEAMKKAKENNND